MELKEAYRLTKNVICSIVEPGGERIKRAALKILEVDTTEVDLSRTIDDSFIWLREQMKKATDDTDFTCSRYTASDLQTDWADGQLSKEISYWIASGSRPRNVDSNLTHCAAVVLLRKTIDGLLKNHVPGDAGRLGATGLAARLFGRPLCLAFARDAERTRFRTYWSTENAFEAESAFPWVDALSRFLVIHCYDGPYDWRAKAKKLDKVEFDFFDRLEAAMGLFGASTPQRDLFDEQSGR
ncbi:MAG: hypothetical protein QNJ11_19930 [Woeseiaceae bacterium]|nr:hypothetical protein [Woeseiaceae bacterium]